MTHDLTEAFNAFVERCESSLVGCTPIEIVYASSDLHSAESGNEAALSSAINGGGNVYAIWTRMRSDPEWILEYIGQRKRQACRERLKQHLFRKNGRTESKLGKVREAVRSSRLIGITTILVTPDELRTSVEQALIKRLEGNPGWLTWNSHGRTKLKVVKSSKRRNSS